MRASGEVNMWISLTQRIVANCNKQKKKMPHMVNLNESHTTLHGQQVHSHERHSSLIQPLADSFEHCYYFCNSKLQKTSTN